VVHEKYDVAKDTVVHWPEQIVSHMPQTAQNSVNFILASPELFHRVKDKADLDTSKRTLDNINNLLGAVKDVFYEGVRGDVAEDEGEPERPVS